MVILLVHDDRSVLNALATALCRLSKTTCLTAAGISEAAALANTIDDCIHAVICPVELAEADGAALADGLRRRFPNLEAAYLASDPAAAAQRLPGQLVLPAEPLPIEALTGWVEALETSLAPIPRLGDYQLLESIGESPDAVTYRAMQLSVHRIVALERLKPDRSSNAEAVRRFRALVRAKAAVVHQQIASVYEAQELDGAIFYTRELVDGMALPDLLHAGVRLKQETILGLLNAAAEAISYFAQRGIARGPLTPRDVVLGRDQLPRVANIALGEPASGVDERAEIVAVTQAAHAVLDATTSSPHLNQLVNRVRDASPHGLHTWHDFARAVADARQSAVESQAASTRKLSSGTYAIVMRRRRKKRFLFAVIVAGAALIGGILFQWLPYATAPAARPFDEMVRIPAGAFIYQTGERRELAEFWIDKYEVTIAQYAAFLDHLERFPGVSYDHPRQPATKNGHMPGDWNAYYRAARRAGSYQGHRVDVNCPVTMVDFWDAWAYARWKERRLPTEFEWEKAARGIDGRPYPWGTTPDPTKSNTGVDYAERAGGGAVDGHAGWAPVDAKPEDSSPFGVVGLAGNVSEWTDSQMLHPDRLDRQVPVLRGGSFYIKPAEVTLRRAARSAEDAEMTIGFRTASDKAP